MTAHQLVISPAAQNDLKEIYHYGFRRWGQKQSESYFYAMKRHFWLLTDQPMMGASRPELMPEIRSISIGSHTLFYRVTSNNIEIIRLLHHHQDPQRHLK